MRRGILSTHQADKRYWTVGAVAGDAREAGKKLEGQDDNLMAPLLHAQDGFRQDLDKPGGTGWAGIGQAKKETRHR